MLEKEELEILEVMNVEAIEERDEFQVGVFGERDEISTL